MPTFLRRLAYAWLDLVRGLDYVLLGGRLSGRFLATVGPACLATGLWVLAHMPVGAHASMCRVGTCDT